MNIEIFKFIIENRTFYKIIYKNDGIIANVVMYELLEDEKIFEVFPDDPTLTEEISKVLTESEIAEKLNKSESIMIMTKIDELSEFKKKLMEEIIKDFDRSYEENVKDIESVKPKKINTKIIFENDRFGIQYYLIKSEIGIYPELTSLRILYRDSDYEKLETKNESPRQVTMPIQPEFLIYPIIDISSELGFLEENQKNNYVQVAPNALVGVRCEGDYVYVPFIVQEVIESDDLKENQIRTQIGIPSFYVFKKSGRGLELIEIKEEHNEAVSRNMEILLTELIGENSEIEKREVIK